MIFFLLITFLNYEEEALIKDILSYKYLEIKDLSFEKDKSIFTNLKDSLTLFFLKEPLKIPEYAEKTYKDFNSDEREIIEKIFKLKIKEENFENILEETINNLQRAKEIIKNSFSDIKKEKLDTLIYNITLLFEDENDKNDDTLYAIFEREKGNKIKAKKWNEKKIAKYLLKINREKLFQGLKISFENLIFLTYSLINAENLRDTVIKTELGYIVINSKREDNIYKGDSFFIIVDLKGNDKYLDKAGSSNLFYSIPFSILIDKEGNDSYISNKALSICSSFFGVSIQFDLKGNDLRRGKFFSISSSLFGISFLFDKEGNDIYESDFFSQSACFFGKSFLFDFDGNDLYKVTEKGQAFSGTLGFSILYDRKGMDSYIAYGKNYHIPLLPDETRSFAQGFSLGIRPYLGGGVAFLIDREGNDVYYSEVYGQGSSYWYGTGILIDGEGNDLYHLAEYGQGSGIHLACGALFDLEGDDEYISRFGPAQGEGHDYSVGMLIDKKGHDTYKVSGGQGIGLNTSVGIFIDSEGNDIYVTTEEFGQGGGKMSRGKIGIGIFIDLKGKDFYKGENLKKEPFLISKGEFGLSYDPDTVKSVEPEEEGIDMEIPLDLDIDSLFKLASEWEVGKYKKIVPKARKILAQRKEDALIYIFNNKIRTLNSLELRAIKEVIKENKELSAPYMRKALKEKNDTSKLNIIYLTGEAEVKEMEKDLWKLLRKEKRDLFKANIIYSLSKLKTENFEELFKYLNENNTEIKISLIRACGEIKRKKILKKIVPLLQDKDALVRFGAEKILRDNVDSVRSYLIDKINQKASDITIFHLLRVFKGIKEMDSEVKEVFLKFCENENKKIRAEAIESLLNFKDDEEISKKLKEIKEKEKEPYILWIFQSKSF
ncbi:MAG: hypothetical protein ABIN15_07895 [candidate division WOR-3 bacterium]